MKKAHTAKWGMSFGEEKFIQKGKGGGESVGGENLC